MAEAPFCKICRMKHWGVKHDLKSFTDKRETSLEIVEVRHKLFPREHTEPKYSKGWGGSRPHPKKYQNNAERQKAYRERKEAGDGK